MEKIGKYEIVRTLGKGATAVVYLARAVSTRGDWRSTLQGNRLNQLMARRLPGLPPDKGGMRGVGRSIMRRVGFPASPLTRGE